MEKRYAYICKQIAKSSVVSTPSVDQRVDPTAVAALPHLECGLCMGGCGYWNGFLLPFSVSMCDVFAYVCIVLKFLCRYTTIYI